MIAGSLVASDDAPKVHLAQRRSGACAPACNVVEAYIDLGYHALLVHGCEGEIEDCDRRLGRTGADQILVEVPDLQLASERRRAPRSPNVPQFVRLRPFLDSFRLATIQE